MSKPTRYTAGTIRYVRPTGSMFATIATMCHGDARDFIIDAMSRRAWSYTDLLDIAGGDVEALGYVLSSDAVHYDAATSTYRLVNVD